ncbi:tRNA pseudouridine synthase 1 [Apophysomyces ossiformis]|uniref:tRNA pseudouridine synthase 1 n=1 Tax=Apophysomyces ossiformis TaxID=679940 RepID=A0A8H7BJ42_9FUNG|nr:tRNA pseudouridine synthase 1 [Apophysomyces ossiformis]
MQINPTARSIEAELFDAMCKAGAVSKDNSVDPKKVQLQRAARTDKGVHAAGNVVSMKLIVEDEDVVDKINSFLPEQIRVWGYVETRRSFQAKNLCDSRIYEYLLPTYVFLPPAHRELKEKRSSTTDLEIRGRNESVPRYITRSSEEELAMKHAYRITQQNYDKFKEALSMFVGTHNFHNYTIRRDYTDISAKRYMMEIKASEPMIIQGMEWISVKLHGQSFMLHQIRKMISMAMLAVRSNTPLSIISKTFGSTKINIPKAPALGLLLEQPVFDSYNQHVTEKGQRQPITFEKYQHEIDKFKMNWIYTKIFEDEKRRQVFDDFLLMLDSHIGPEFAYLNPEAVIPEEAVMVLGRTSKTTEFDDEEEDNGEAAAFVLILERYPKSSIDYFVKISWIIQQSVFPIRITKLRCPSDPDH